MGLKPLLTPGTRENDDRPRERASPGVDSLDGASRTRSLRPEKGSSVLYNHEHPTTQENERLWAPDSLSPLAHRARSVKD